MSQENKILIKEFTSKSSAIDVEKRQIRFLASTPDVDRDGEKILPTAFEKSIPGFMKNPIFLPSHKNRLDNGEPPVIGVIVSAWVDAKIGLWTVVKFAVTELAEKWWVLYRDGFMKAVSVSFLPIKSHYEVIEGKQILTFDEVEWLELSACTIPSNRGALVRSKQNKLAFVQEKREDRELEKFLAEVRQQDPEFDVKCEEFAEILMTMDLNGHEMPDRAERDYSELIRR